MAHRARLLSFFLFSALWSFQGHGQISTRVAAVHTDEVVAGMPVRITVDLRQTAGLQSVVLLYRPFGESEYRRLDMDVVGNRATVQVPGTAVTPPFLEYYIVLQDVQGTFEVYPLSDSPHPLTTPPQSTSRIEVRERTEAELQAIFLSPEPFSVTTPEEVLISASLLRADSTLDRDATRLLLDGVDVTAKALFSGDLIVFAPANIGMLLEPGNHTVSLRLFNRDGHLQGESTVTFVVGSEVPLFRPEPPVAAFRYDASIQLESRYEDIGTSDQWYNRARLQFRGRTGTFQMQSNLFITSDEKSDRQPQNRYLLGVALPWLTLDVGDSYPEFTDLILSGKRVRGVHSTLELGVLNVNVAYGSVTRAIDGTLLQRFPTDSLLVEQARNPGAAFAQLDSATWGRLSYGTYERTLFAVRPSFGSGEIWQLGFTWLSARDDLGSIRYGIRPQENIVLGTDFAARFDDRRIELSWEAAFSAFNSDISSGPFTDAHIDSVFPEDASAIKSARDILDPFITVNDNLRPLSFKKLATLAGQASLALNYFDNALKFTYLYRGNDYNSFGQTYLRTDIRGINVIDHIRILRNQVFATVGLERLQDNTAATKGATTTFSNINAAVSVYPFSDFPGVTLGYSRFDNDNDLAPDSLAAIRDITNRVYLQTTYGFDLGVHHTAMFNASSSVRNDYTMRNQDVSSRSVAIALASQFSIPLQTELSLALNLNDLPASSGSTSRKFNYTVLSLHGRYELLPNTVTCTATIGPTFGDVARTVLDGGLEWHISPPMTLNIQAGTFTSSNTASESFFSIRYRYDL
jgi:hypothetical protein